MSDLPAILGGRPAFERLVPVIQSTVRNPESLVPMLTDILASGRLTSGPRVAAFEDAVRDRLGVAAVVATGSCTAGLMLALQAAQLPSGAEVLVPAFTFTATAHAVVWNRLRPIFVDSLADTGELDPESAAAAITPRTVAVMPVDIFGLPVDIEAIQRLAERHALALVFDSAQSLGGEYRGRPVGGAGLAQVFSLSPTKVVTAAEGGLIATNDEGFADLVRRGRDYGKASDGADIEFAGLSARMSELHAAVGLHNFQRLDAYQADRLRLIARYRAGLEGVPGLRFQFWPADRRSSGNYMVIVVEDAFGMTRDLLYDALRAENIQTKKYFYPPLHRQTAYRREADLPDGALPVAEDLARRTLALPLYSHMRDDLVDALVGCIAALHRHAGAIAARMPTAASR